MKTKLICIVLLLVALAARSQNMSSAQSDSIAFAKGIRGRVQVTVGAGLNTWGTLMQFFYRQSAYWSDTSYYEINGASQPMLIAAADVGITRRIAAGAEFGYQTAKITITDPYHVSANKPIPYVDRWQRLHFELRGDYYILLQERTNVYTGLQFGYNVFSMRSERSSADPGYTSRLDVEPLPISIQVHLGGTYYFNPHVGINAELGLGIGGPYLLAAGLGVKI